MARGRAYLSTPRFRAVRGRDELRPAAGPPQAVGSKRDGATERIEDSLNAFASCQLTHPSHEVLVPVVDGHGAEPLDRWLVASRAGPKKVNSGHCAKFELRDSNPAG